MTPPRPVALRLVCRSTNARIPEPPFGLRAWSPDAHDMAVLVDGAEFDVDSPVDVAVQIPRAVELPRATIVFVLGSAARGRGAIGWLGRTVRVSRAARCTALVARGYVGVCAGTDDAGADLAWGLSSPR